MKSRAESALTVEILDEHRAARVVEQPLYDPDNQPVCNRFANSMFLPPLFRTFIIVM